MSTDEAAAKAPDVSIVIVSWNVRELLKDCLHSIELHRGTLACETIVVDNRSADASAEMVRRDFPSVVLIANADNVGFAVANNQGFEVARGRTVFILNPDTLLVDDSLPRMVRILEENPGLGVVGPRLCYPNGEIQEPCARRLPSLLHVLVHELLALDRAPWVGSWVRPLFRGYSYESSHPVEAVSGAAMLARRDVLARLRGFGTFFVHCGEDLDLCYRAQRAGWGIWYQHDCRVVHFAGQSSKQASEWATVNSLRSYGEYFARCGGPLSQPAYRAMVIFFWAPAHLVRGAVKRLVGQEAPDRFRERWRTVRSVVAGRRM